MNHLGVFAKYWEPGNVKTRLAAAIGNTNAATLYREFVRQTLIRHAESGDRRSVWIAPPESHQSFQDLGSAAWDIRAQSTGNLGDRMRDFFQQNFAETKDASTTRVILIGSDTPVLSAYVVKDAFERLANHDCVLGPSQDGGYYLIGMRGKAFELFRDVSWSTNSVWNQTNDKLNSLGLSVGLLPEHNDVDDEADLQLLQRYLVESTGCPFPDSLDLELLNAINRLGVADDAKC